MRLIDADALKGALEKLKAETLEYEDSLDDVDAIIDAAPTVEAVPLEHHNKIKGILDNEIKSLVDILDNERPRGKWKIDGCLIACDQCGRILLKASELYNFCPQCGAQMKGGADLRGGET